MKNRERKQRVALIGSCVACAAILGSVFFLLTGGEAEAPSTEKVIVKKNEDWHRLEKSHESLQETLSENQTLIDALKLKNEEKQKQLSDLLQTLNVQTTNLNALNEKVEHLSTTAPQQEIQKLLKQIDLKSSLIEDIQISRTGLEDELEKTQKKVKLLEKTLETVQEFAESKGDSQEQLLELQDDYKEQLAELNAENIKFHTLLQERTEKLKELQSNLDSYAGLKEELANLKKEQGNSLSDNSSIIEALSKEKDELERILSEKTQTIQHLTKQVATASQDQSGISSQTLLSEKEELSKVLQEREEAIASLKASLSEYEPLKKRLNELEEQNASWRSEQQKSSLALEQQKLQFESIIHNKDNLVTNLSTELKEQESLIEKITNEANNTIHSIDGQLQQALALQEQQEKKLLELSKTERNLEDENLRFETLYQEQERAILGLREVQTNLQEKVFSSNMLVNSLEEQLQSWESINQENEEHEETIISLKKLLTDKRRELTSKTEETSQLLLKQKQYIEQLAHLDKVTIDLNQSQQDFLSQIEKLKDLSRQYNKEKKDAVAEAHSFEKELKSTLIQNETFQATITTQKKRLVAFETTLESKDKRLQEQDEYIASLEQDKSINQDILAAKLQLEEKLSQALQEIEDLQNSLHQQATLIAEHNLKLAEYEDDLLHLRKQESDASKIAQELNDTLNEERLLLEEKSENLAKSLFEQDAIQESLSSLQANFNTLKEKNQELTFQIATSNAKQSGAIQVYQQAIVDKDKKIDDLETLLASHEESIFALQNSLHEEQEKFQIKIQEAEQLFAKNTHAQESIAQLKESHQMTVETLKEQVDSWQQEYQVKELKNQEQLSKIVALEGDLLKQSQLLNEKTQHISQLNSSQGDQNTQFKQLETLTASLSEENAELRHNLDQYKTELIETLAKHEDDFINTDNQVASLKNQLNDINHTAKNQSNIITQQAEELHNLMSELQQATLAKEDNLATISRQETKLSKIHNQFSDSQKYLSDLEQQLSEQKNELAAVSEQLLNSRKYGNDSELVLREQEERINAFEQQLSEERSFYEEQIAQLKLESNAHTESSGKLRELEALLAKQTSDSSSLNNHLLKKEETISQLSDQIRKLQQNVQQGQHEIASLSNELRGQSNQLGALHELERSLDQLEHEKETQLRTLSAKDEHILALEETLAEERRALLEKAEQLNATLSQKDRDIAALNELQGLTEQLQNELADSKGYYRATLDESDDKISKLQAQIKSLKAKVNSSASSSQAQIQKIALLEHTLANEQSTLADKSQQLEILLRAQGDKSSIISEYDKSLQTLKVKNKKLEQTLATEKHSGIETKQELLSLNEVLESVEQDYSEQAKELTRLQAKLQLEQSALQEKTREVSELLIAKGETNNMSSKLEALEATLSEKTKLQQDSEAELGKLTLEHKEHERLISQLNQDRESLTSKLSQLNQEHELQFLDLNKHKQQNQALAKQSEDLQTELTHWKSVRLSTEGELAAVYSEAEALSTQIGELRAVRKEQDTLVSLLQQQSTALQNENAELNELETLLNNSQNTIEQQELAVKALREKEFQYQGTIQKLTSQSATLAQEQQELKQAYSYQESLLGKLQSQLQEMSQSVETGKNTEKSLIASRDARKILEVSVIELKKKLRDSQQSYRTLEKDKGRINQELSQLKNHSQQATDILTTVQDQQERLQNNLESTRQELSDTYEALKKKDRQVAALQAQLSQKQKLFQSSERANTAESLEKSTTIALKQTTPSPVRAVPKSPEAINTISSLKDSQSRLYEELKAAKNNYQSWKNRHQEAQEIADNSDVNESSDSITRIHLVSKGETLSGISLRYYGNTGRWVDIFEANRQSIHDKNLLKTGTALVIP